MQNIINEIITLFAGTQYLNTDDTLNKNLLELETLEHKTDFIPYLLKSKTTKEHFFEKIEEALVFNSQKFLTFLRQKALFKESYTKFRSIALSESYTQKPIKHFGEVVLNFPYKECILEGGQKREEEKREEIYYNTILAPDEITRLTEAKVITNVKRVTKEGEAPLTSFEKKDNFLIKGNNLLALHSLKKKFAGKVKLIYIDPPYNTGNDGFKYNDKFNHSTWLVFMKNRLEVAKELLAEDGVIFVQIDNSPSSIDESPELGHLLVLLDEIFGRKNYITSFVWKKKGNASNTEDNIGTITESILMYTKDFNKIAINLQEYKRIYRYEDEFGRYNLEHPVKTNNGEYERETMLFEIITQEGNFLPPKGKRWTIGENLAKEFVSKNKYKICDGKFYIKAYPEDYKKGEYKLHNNLFSEQGSLKSAKNELKSLGFNREEFSTPKPEALLERIIQIATKEGDLVLDFFAGSGTTGAVAHKMNRRWIMIEQMEYIETITKVRLQKVLEGEQGGVSKNHKWQGGGSFVYLELAKWNLKFMEEINQANSTQNLLEIYKRLKQQAFFRYDFSAKLLENNLEEFKKGTLEEQKKLLTEVLDANHLYINLGELEDKAYELSSSEIKLNKEFYE